MAIPHDVLSGFFFKGVTPEPQDKHGCDDIGQIEIYTKGNGCWSSNKDFCSQCCRRNRVVHIDGYSKLSDHPEEQDQEVTKYCWVKDPLKGKKKKKMKVLSEVLRRLSSCDGIFRTSKKRRMLYQYDPKSYALNFDDGIHRKEGRAHCIAVTVESSPRGAS